MYLSLHLKLNAAHTYSESRYYILINIEFNPLLLVSIVWPVMYRLDDPTETDNQGKSSIFLLLLIFCVYIFHLETLLPPSSPEFKLVSEKLIEIGNL